MTLKKNKNILDYLVLLLLVVTYLTLVMLVSFNPKEIKLFTLGFASLYFFWGIYHHHKEKSLHPKITLEYLIVALLGSWLIIGIF